MQAETCGAVKGCGRKHPSVQGFSHHLQRTARRPEGGQRDGECYPDWQMFRALYRQIARFLNWVNRTGLGSSASRTTREAENHRVEDHVGSSGWDKLKGGRLTPRAGRLTAQNFAKPS